MLGERLGGGLGEVVSGAARRVELQHQREGLTAHRLLDRWQLMQVVTGEDGAQALGPRLDVALPAGLRSTDPSRAADSFAAAAGSGATASTARASRESRPAPLTWNAASAAGKYCLRCERSWLDSCPRFHAASCWARASTAIAWASSESAGNGRCAAASVRRMFASAIASAWSDFARATVWRSRYRATAIGLIEYTLRPGRAQARDQQAPRGLHRDRDRLPGVSPASASSSSSCRYPCTSSLMRRFATSFPASSTSATSWWPSAQSIPQVIVNPVPPLSRSWPSK